MFIGDFCVVYGKEGVFRLNIILLGDLCFVFEKDIEFICLVFMEYYGVDIGEILEGKIVFFNKFLSEDDVYEIIFDGYVFGYVKYNLFELKWYVGLKVEGVIVFWKCFGKKMKKWIVVDKGVVGLIKKGVNLMVVGVFEVDLSIRVGDEVIFVIEDGEVFVIGIVKKDYDVLMRGERGIGVKLKR